MFISALVMLLEVKSLSVRYGRMIALTDIDLNVMPGALVALIGANGAGKSTLLRTISGLIPARAGSISFNGETIRGRPAHRIALRGIGHVPEGRGLLPNITVAENLRIGAYGSATADPGGVERVLDVFPALRKRLKQPASVLSGGEQQMLSLARALLKRPKLLMVDEMSLGLAPKLVHELLDIILKLKASGLSILCVEQHTRLILKHADYVYGLKSGRICIEGVPDDLRDGQINRLYMGAVH